MKMLLGTLILVSMFQTRAFALGVDGKAGSGGGNTLNGELIETYGGHTTAELPGYAEALAVVKNLVPLFALYQDHEIQAKNIYLIPDGNFNQLPMAITTLDFNTDVPCYQTAQELFCDQVELNTMNPSQLKNLFIHELVLSYMLDDSHEATIADVRYVVGLMIRAQPDDKKIADAMESRNLGNFDSGTDVRNFEKNYRTKIELDSLNHYCTSNSDGYYVQNKYDSEDSNSIAKRNRIFDFTNLVNSWYDEDTAKYSPKDDNLCAALRLKYKNK